MAHMIACQLKVSLGILKGLGLGVKIDGDYEGITGKPVTSTWKTLSPSLGPSSTKNRFAGVS